jgi:protease I
MAASNDLQGKRVAILATDMVEEAELVEPRRALDDAGATTELVSLQNGEIQSFHDLELSFGKKYAVDRTIEEVSVDDYDALVLPGGVGNPDRLRIDENAVAFVRAFVDSGRPVGVICHGPWTLVEAGSVRGRRITSWPSLQTDIRNAGGEWVDEQVVVDNGLVSSRKPDDIPAFNERLIEQVSERRHATTGACARGGD